MFVRHFLTCLAGLALCAATATAQKEKEVEFADLKLKFTVPAGWKVLKTEKKKDAAFVVLQETQIAKGAKSKALVGIWLGKKWIADAPAQGDVKGGNDASGALWASRRVLAWAAGTPEKIQPLPAVDAVFGFTAGDKSVITAEYKTKTQAVYAVGSEKRDGGELTAAGVADSDAMDKVKAVLDKLVGKEK